MDNELELQSTVVHLVINFNLAACGYRFPGNDKGTTQFDRVTCPQCLKKSKKASAKVAQVKLTQKPGKKAKVVESDWTKWQRQALEKQKKETDTLDAARKAEEDNILAQAKAKETKGKRATTDREKELITALARCYFYKGSFADRFIHSLYTFPTTMQAHPKIIPVEEITELQGYWIQKLAEKNRRQLSKYIDLEK